ncbi:MAG: hypothetical protein WHV67_00530, partial [Thermoanaerobaculia bacterium]
AFIDGIISKVGAYDGGSNCDITCQYYYYSGEESDSCGLKRNTGFLDRMAIPSPLVISTSLDFNKETLQGTLYIHIVVDEDITLSQNKIWVVIYERNVESKEGKDEIIYSQLARERIFLQNFNLTKKGEEIDYTVPFSINSNWVLENIGILIFVQSDQNKEILQSSFVQTLLKPERRHRRPF